MQIGLLAPPFQRVPPVRYGGTERVIAALADALVARGHDVTLYASADSETSARLVPIIDRPVWDEPRYSDESVFAPVAVARAYQHAARLDIMHNHLAEAAYPTARAARVPTVTTLHWRLDAPEMRLAYEEFRDQPVVSVSDAQRVPLPDANWVATIHHGYPRDLYRPRFERGEYLVFCGRFTAEKGVGDAIAVALAAGIPLRIAGRRPSGVSTHPAVRAEREFFEATVVPHLDHPLIEYVGEVTDREKQELFERALALLFPIDWPEPFGLVMIEALACGTPVLARPRGAVPEVIADGVSGAHCETVADFVAALRRIDTLDRRTCRAEFERRFAAERMAIEYERVYERVLEAASAHPGRVLSLVERATHAETSADTVANGRAHGDSAPVAARSGRRRLAAAERRRFEHALADIFQAAGMRLGTPGTVQTPERFLAALFEATRGYEDEDTLVTAFPAATGDASATRRGQVVEGPIAFAALCEHHALPFYGDAWVSYVPGERVVVAATLAHIVRRFARRFTAEERMAEEIATAVERAIRPLGVAVCLDVVHLCGRVRGVEETDSRTRTTVWRGCHVEDETRRAEFIRLCAPPDAGHPVTDVIPGARSADPD